MQAARTRQGLAIPGVIVFGGMAALSVPVAITNHDRQMWILAVVFALRRGRLPALRTTAPQPATSSFVGARTRQQVGRD